MRTSHLRLESFGFGGGAIRSVVGFEVLSDRGGALFLIDDSGCYIDAFLAKLLKAVLLALQDVLHDLLGIVGKDGTEFFRLQIQQADGHHLFAFNG